MATIVKDLIEAGIHFGQRRSNWNPKMKPYIYGLRNKIHVVDIRETVKGLLLAKKFVQRVVAEGKDVCFVGTKRQARAAVRAIAALRAGAWSVAAIQDYFPHLARPAAEPPSPPAATVSVIDPASRHLAADRGSL